MTKHQTRRFIKLTLVTLVTIAFIYGLYRASDKGYRVYGEYIAKEKIRSDYIKFVDSCLTEKDRSDHDVVLDSLRHCVHLNSVHTVDKEFHSTAKEGLFAFEKKVFSYSKGELEKKPHLECSTRSILLTDLYRELGYKARKILLVKRGDNFLEHIVTEVLNPLTKQYEIQDPSYDVHLKSLSTNHKLSIHEAIQLSENDFVPCNINNDCSWGIVSPDKKSAAKNIKPYFDLSYTNWNNKKQGQLIFNSKKFSPYDLFLNGGVEMSYCDKRPQHCKKKIDFPSE